MFTENLAEIFFEKLPVLSFLTGAYDELGPNRPKKIHRGEKCTGKA
jgi:hypothetical protein